MTAPHGTIVPRKLNADERAAYDRDGYVVVPAVFDPEQVAQLNAEIDDLMARREVLKDSGDRFVHGFNRYSSLLHRLMEDERIVALVEDLVGPGLAIHSSKVLEKKANDTAVCHWHQDEYYYRQQTGAESACCLSAWIPLVDTSPDNGCLRVQPGSHRPGLLEHQRIDFDTCRLAIRPGDEALDGALDCRMKAGDVLLFSAHLLHSSRGNRTTQPRRALIISYQEATRPILTEQGRVLRPA